MPSWGAVLKEINDLKAKGNNDAFDLVRRKYLATAYQLTRRATILYASKWTQPDPQAAPALISVSEHDVHGLMEAVHGVKEKQLDLILHSPGGSLEAAEAIVKYLRSQFDHIRVIVPHAAMSAATMICCAADEIVMGDHSFLGPTDPQFILQTALGVRSVPAQAILSQFWKAQEECQDPRKLTAWVPMLHQFGPDLLTQCENVCELSQSVVKEWLEKYMFKGQADGPQKAADIATWLSTHENFKSHARHLSRADVVSKGLKAARLEDSKAEQDAFLSVFHAASHTFSATGVVKIIENHAGNAYINQVQQVMVVQQPKQPGGGPFGPAPLVPPFPKKK